MNIVVTDRTFDQPVRVTLDGAGDALFVQPGAVLGVGEPGTVVVGEDVD